MKRLFWALAALVLVAAFWTVHHAFRREIVISELGVLEYRYQWGQRRWLFADTNKDGITDAKARFWRGTPHFPAEYWEDRDLDGVFDISVRYLEGQPGLAEVDEDGDGTYDRQVSEDELQRLFSSELRERFSNE